MIPLLRMLAQSQGYDYREVVFSNFKVRWLVSDYSSFYQSSLFKKLK